MINNESNIDEEPGINEPHQDIITNSKSKRGAYKQLKRDLDEEELNSKGTQKLLLNDLDRLEEEVLELKIFRDRFYETDKNYNVTKEQLRSLTSKDVFYTIVISIGGTIIGLSPSIWSSNLQIAICVLIAGILLIIGSLISKFRK